MYIVVVVLRIMMTVDRNDKVNEGSESRSRERSVKVYHPGRRSADNTGTGEIWTGNMSGLGGMGWRGCNLEGA